MPTRSVSFQVPVIKVVICAAVLLLTAMISCGKKSEISAESEIEQSIQIPEVHDLSDQRREVSQYLMEEGLKFAQEWSDSMHAKVASIEDKAELQKQWDILKMTTATPLLRASLSLYHAALIVDSTNYSVYHWISYPLDDSGDRKGAIEACEKYIRSVGESANVAYAWLGRLYYEDGQREKAMQTFKKQIMMNPGNEVFYRDTRYYLELSDFTPKQIEEVLALSEVHKGN